MSNVTTLGGLTTPGSPVDRALESAKEKLSPEAIYLLAIAKQFFIDQKKA